MAAAAPVEFQDVRIARGETLAIHSLTLRVEAGERVFLLGPNGAGKTSVLLSVVGAVEFAGRISVGGVRVEKRSLGAVRRDTAFVFADPSDQFFLADVDAEVTFGLRERGLPPDETRARADAALCAVGLVGVGGRRPLELSLGEQRRLAVATALAIEPRVLLFDEPTASLDPRARSGLLDVMASLSSTLLVATHDLDAALSVGGRVVLLSEGRVVADGKASELLVDAPLLDRAGLALPLSVAGRR